MNTSDDDIWATPSAGQTPRPAPDPHRPAAYPATPPPPHMAPGPYGSPPPQRDWMGIVSLVCGLLGVGLVGIIFGHLALRANARGEANNRGLSLAGTIVSYVTTILGTLAIAGFISFIATNDDFQEGFQEGWESEQAWDNFGVDDANAYVELWVDREPLVGECLHYAESLMDDLRVVDCDSVHVGEVFASAPVSNIAQGEDAYSDGAQNRAMEMCDQEFDPYVGESVWSSDYDWWFFIATEDLTVDRDDPFICVASRNFEPTMDIARSSGR